ncbi:MAG: hypothetical protein IT488_10440 [Gammaproteobacteria bacterium]|nr:hypothetical protein [Gammaproteobacteria bacterium]
MNPILRYLDIKHQVTSDLVFYANVIDAADLNEEMQERRLQRQKNNRRHAAEMRAAYYRLPKWYRAYLKRVGEDPIAASTALIGLSNSGQVIHGEDFLPSLSKSLRIPDNVHE